ncbi:MAG: hypothetical protein CMO78_02710, partial [Verrucomicrobiales bacterium]|nr:hypothetical protein [Verrucomicrobiales bacterium]
MMEIFGFLLIVGLSIGIFYGYKSIADTGTENKDFEKEQSESKKFNAPKFNLPKFKDSGWVLFYVICGWIGLVAMIVFFVQEESTFGFMMLGCSLSCFFGAHVLRLQEKVAFHAEQQTELLE